MYSHVLIPIDGSAASLSAVAVASRLVDGEHGTVTLLNVIPDGGLPAGLEEWAKAEYPDESPRWRYSEALARRLLDSARLLAREHGYHRIEEQVRTGDISSQINDCATQVRADVIVIGTRGLSFMKSIALGSVAQKLLHTAQLPVVAVHDPAAAPD